MIVIRVKSNDNQGDYNHDHDCNETDGVCVELSLILNLNWVGQFLGKTHILQKKKKEKSHVKQKDCVI